MRRLLVLPVLLASLGLLSACGADSASRTGAAAPPGASACDEVRLGIDAFNAGELDETVAHFERAVPLAESEAEADDSREAAALVEAVHYYADLPADDYPEAATTSPEFARYKAITLGLCMGEGQPDGLPTESPEGQLT